MNWLKEKERIETQLQSGIEEEDEKTARAELRLISQHLKQMKAGWKEMREPDAIKLDVMEAIDPYRDGDR